MITAGTAWDFDPPTAADNCGSVTLSVLSTGTNTANQLPGLDAVLVTRTWSAIDAAGKITGKTEFGIDGGAVSLTNLNGSFSKTLDTVSTFDPDLLGTQETVGFQRDFIAEKLPQYEVLGVGRNDGRESGAARPPTENGGRVWT